jgi:uracil-DNA glycosylase family 4
MPYSGNGNRRVLIVGEIPETEEDKQGNHFVGESGRFLESTLKQIGVDMRRDCWLTNSVICHPPGNKIKDDKVVDYCRPNLINTIKKLKPDVTILLGGTAVSSLIPYVWGSKDVGNISRWVGWKAPSQKINSWVCPTWRPSSILQMEHQPVYEAYFRKHLTEAFALEGKPWRTIPDYRSSVATSLVASEAIDFLDSLTSGVMAFDYETDRLKPEGDARIISCAVCWNGTHNLAFPITKKVEGSLKRLLSDKRVGKIAANMKFEDRWSKAKLGVLPRPWLWDTMLNAHMLDNRRSITSLKLQAFVELGLPAYNENIEPFFSADGGTAQNRIHEIELVELLEYNSTDALLEYLIADRQVKQLGYESVHELVP